MKRVYIAGPMTGLPGLNFAAFHERAARLRAAGFEVENPAEINADVDAKWEDCMRADIARLVLCDAVLTLPGWEKSRGASLEVHIARALGMVALPASDFLPSWFPRETAYLHAVEACAAERATGAGS